MNSIPTAELIEHLDRWLAFYPEDVFPPVAHAEHASSTPPSSDRIAAHAMRHVLRVLRTDIETWHADD